MPPACIVLFYQRELQERVTGVAAHGDDFASSVRRYVPVGYAFRGFPIVFNHMSPSRIIRNLKESPAARAILLVCYASERVLTCTCA
jgi:hypothetical protein